MEEKYCNELCVPWEETLVIQLLGKKISYPIMLSRLKLLWKLHQGYDLRDVGHVYFMVKYTLVWIRFPSLKMVFSNESFLLRLASVLDTPITVDTNTLNAERGKFSRVCMEVNLNKLMVGKVNVRDEYESLHLLCGHCLSYGHQSWDCSLKLAQKPSPKLVVVEDQPGENIVTNAGYN
ncbi:hypothetical protein JHK86_050150 [Glycine max]|nr:hypothetical protein JHK86_050150 [Glycine max]